MPTKPTKAAPAKVAAKATPKKAPVKKPASKPAVKRPVAKKPEQPKKEPVRGSAAVAEERYRIFAVEYLVDLNATQAAIRTGYSEKTAMQQGSALLSNPKVQSFIEEERQKRSERTEITIDKVLKRLWSVATADANELTQLRRENCRYCWGVGHQYQWTTAEYQNACTMAEANEDEPPSSGGGFGFDMNKAPNPNCPECGGHGKERVHIHDTRSLSEQAKLLYAGVKQTKFGIEIQTHSQEAALLNVAKHLGMFSENINMKLKGEMNVNSTLSEEQAKRIAMEILKGGESK